LTTAGLLLGCEQDEAPSSYVARVGDHYLTQEKLDQMLRGMGPVPDSTEARQQVIQQWIDETLLYREAVRRNLPQAPEVQRLLEERRRNTLVSALTNRIYEDIQQEPSEEQIRTYFERHQQQLALREPYVRVRHLSTPSEDSARSVRRDLVSAREATIDSIWTQLCRRYAERPERALQLSNRFLPEGRLFAQLPYVEDELSVLREGEVAPVIEDNNQYHVLQLVRRIPEGAEPELEWMRNEIQRRLQIRHRKQMYAREVQRLRNRAKANDLIEAP
jgi:parvulin-like peptidyl-prolyl isomerase